MIRRNPFLWICRIVATLILLFTFYYKITGSPESVHVFSEADMEPYGRYSVAIAEFVAAMLIIIPRTSLAGALLAVVIMICVIASHIFVLGIQVMNDRGRHFIAAVVVAICSMIIIYAYTKRVNTRES